MTAGFVTGVVRCKAGVSFSAIAPAGMRLLAAIDATARALCLDLTITSACDGAHSGPADPHHRGEAYDVRTHAFTEELKDRLLAGILERARDQDEPAPAPVVGAPRSLASRRFFGQIEAPGAPAEHLHVQLRRGASYP